MRISSPPTTHSCFYGIDTPERGELLAARHRSRRWPIRSASTAWRSSRSTGCIARSASADRDPARPHYCDACFTGDYPIALPDQADNSDRQLSLLAESH